METQAPSLAAIAKTAAGRVRHLRNSQRAATIGRRLESVSWALTDQVLFAGANFLLALLTARWMDPEEFGALATALVVQTLVISAYEAAFNEPMTVFGAGRYREQFQRYLGTLLLGHLVVTAVVASVILLASWMIAQAGHGLLAGGLFGLGASIPLVLLRYLARRACYAIDRSRSATIGGVIYAVTLFLSVGFFARNGSISQLAVFGSMALASGFSGVSTLWILRPAAPDRPLLQVVPLEHWRYSRWSMGTVLIKQMPFHIWYFVLPIWAGLEGNAALRALSNLNLLMGHMMGAFGMVLLPALVRALGAGPQRFRAISVQATAGLVAVTGGYWVTVALFGEPLVSLMYDGKYVEYAPLLMIHGFAPVVSSLGIVGAARAQAAERPDLHFRSAIVTIIATVPALGLAYLYGLVGVIWGSLLVTVVGTVSLLRATYRDVSEWRE